MSFSSSSSSDFCLHPECLGFNCEHFKDWYLLNITSEVIFVRFVSLPLDIQQVEIYRDLNYYHLIAVGQLNLPGTINLYERNGSGISGSVYWDGTLVNSIESSILYCYDLSSSSSSSSIDSSSDSSSSSSSSSSSLSICDCDYLYCDGNNCNQFSNWLFFNIGFSNSDFCKLYIGYDFIDGSKQQIRVYKDKNLSQLVAIGQSDDYDQINIQAVNGSNLFGQVDWSGLPVEYLQTSVLQCSPFSSSSESSSSSLDSSSSSSLESSSSSSSSIDSSSSSSSSSLDYSDSSVSSLSSKSSASSSSSSSSSSFDSSSSSSESFNNFSSSSSSSIEILYEMKPLFMVDSLNYVGRFAQNVYVLTQNYSVGKCYCYFKPNIIDTHFNVNLAIYSCLDDGTPDSQLVLSSLHSSLITKDGWYSFDFNTFFATPDNRFLAFVMWQDGGDEYNYISWSYNFIQHDAEDEFPMFAWVLYHDGIWYKNINIVRSLQVISNFNPYDLESQQLQSVPSASVSTVLSPSESDPSFSNTEVNEADNLRIKFSPLSVSCIIDNSGSMGWNDRFISRQKMINNVVSHLKDNYPNDVAFDFISFSSSKTSSNNAFQNIGNVETINLDLNNPNKYVFKFNFSNRYNIFEGDVYIWQSYNYTVVRTLSDSDFGFFYGEQKNEGSGSLTRVVGLGDEVLFFDGVNVPSLDNVSYLGFKNFKDNRNYIIADVYLDFDALDKSDSNENWFLFDDFNSDYTFVDGQSGPSGGKSKNLYASKNSIFVKSLKSTALFRSFILNDLNLNDQEVFVEDTNFASDLVVSRFDIFDGDRVSLDHRIVSLDRVNNRIIIDPVSSTYVAGKNLRRGVIEQSRTLYSRSFQNKTTLRVLIMDPERSNDDFITIFLQDDKGLSFEWDILPFKQWEYSNWFWFNESAYLSVSIFDENGNPYPNGTKVNFSIDKGAKIVDEDRVSYGKATLIEDAQALSFNVYVNSAEDFERLDEVSLISGSTQQKLFIESIEIINESKFKIGFTSTLENNYEAFKSYITKINMQYEKKGLATVVQLPLFDVTPIETGINIDPSLFKDYDPEPLPASLDPNDLNEKNNIYEDLLRNKKSNNWNHITLLTINGKASCRFLPITEDDLSAVSIKESAYYDLLYAGPPSAFSDQTLLPSDALELNLPTNTVDEDASEELDYYLQTPIFLNGGYASARMYTWTTLEELTSYSSYSPYPPSIQSYERNSHTQFGKSYQVNPYVEILDSLGKTIAVQYFDPVDVSFIHPLKIFSSIGSLYENLDYYREQFDNCGEPLGYERIKCHGLYSVDVDDIVIDYTVSYKSVLVKKANLLINLYYSEIFSQESFVINFVEPYKQQARDYSETYYEEREKETFIVKNDEGKDESVVVPKLDRPARWRSVVFNRSDLFQQETSYEQDPILSRISGGQGGVIGQFQQALKEYQNSILERAKRYDKLLGISTDSGNDDENYDFYGDPNPWKRCNEYGPATFYIPIVNGKAKLILKGPHKLKTLFVEALCSIDDVNDLFNETITSRMRNNLNKTIRNDLIFIRSPLMVGSLSPYRFAPINVEEGERYELSGLITWRDGKDGIIENDTVVEYDLRLEAKPTISKTINGFAGGVIIGPIKPAFYEPQPEDDCPPRPKRFTVEIKISHASGESVVYYRNIYRVPRKLESSGNIFLFKVNDLGSGWADAVNTTDVIIDLNSIENQNRIRDSFITNEGKLIEAYWVGERGVRSLISNNRAVYTPSTRAVERIKYFGTNNGVCTFSFYTLNQNIGHKHNTLLNGPMRPWDIEINFGTSYFDSFTNKYWIGRAAVQAPTPLTPALPPNLRSIEPLSIKISQENSYYRDGQTFCTIVVDVSYRGKFITNKLIFDEGTENEKVIEHPLPKVYFECGIPNGFEGEWNINRIVSGDNVFYKDCRGRLGCVLSVGNSSDAKLSKYIVDASLVRTDVYEKTSHSHTHACIVDEMCNGFTTQTINIGNLDIEVEDHVHNIVNFKAEDATFNIEGENYIHSHSLRSVAITEVLPTYNVDHEFAVIAFAEYDPTSCDPYTGPKIIKDYPKFGNRMMFDSIVLPKEIIIDERELVFDISLSSLQKNENDIFRQEESIIYKHDVESNGKQIEFVINASDSVYDSSKAFNMNFNFNIKHNGEIYTPPDGSRLDLSFTTYKNVSSADNDIFETGPNIVRHYMNIVGKIYFETDELKIEKDFICAVVSDLNWLPSVQALTPKPTNEEIYIQQALTDNQYKSLGFSQIFDALRLSARRLIKEGSENLDFKEYHKIILLFTDGDENNSEISLIQALNSVYFVNKGKVPIVIFKLGNVSSIDDVVCEKIIAESIGYSFVCKDVIENDQINELVYSLITNQKWITNRNNYYDNIFYFSEPLLPQKISLTSGMYPNSYNVVFRSRNVLDSDNNSQWSSWLNHEQFLLFEQKIEYLSRGIEFEIRMFHDYYFNNPLIEHIVIEYFLPATTSVVFNDVDIDSDNQLFSIFSNGSYGNESDLNELNGKNNLISLGTNPLLKKEQQNSLYVSSLFLTYLGKVPQSSFVKYYISQSFDNDFLHFVKPNQLVFIPSRYNEPLVRVTNRQFFATNGPWGQSLSVDIYMLDTEDRRNLELIDVNTYTVQASDGLIIFNEPQDISSSFIINININRVLKIKCEIINYSSESVVLDSISGFYTLTHRVPFENSEVVRFPINLRI